MEYVNLRQHQFQKLKKLDQQDLKSMREFTESRSLENILGLFEKAGVDVENYSKNISNLSQKIEEKYHLSLRENRNEVVEHALKKAAVSQNMSPNCPLIWAFALAYCHQEFPNWEDGYFDCLIWADLQYFLCLVPIE